MEPVVVIAAVAAAVIAATGPRVLAAVPEPPDPPDDKRSYADVAAVWGAWAWMVIPAAAAAGLVAWRIDTPELVPAWVVVCGVGAWLSFVDWHTRYLPFVLTVPLHVALWVLVGLAAMLLDDHRVAVRALVANVVVFVVFRVLYWIGRRFSGGALGYGDVRLAAALAVPLGPLGATSTIVGVYAGFVVGAVCGVVLSLLKVVDSKSFAFGPYLVLGAVIGACWTAG